MSKLFENKSTKDRSVWVWRFGDEQLTVSAAKGADVEVEYIVNVPEYEAKRQQA
ncbi:hypothetical protein [Microbispora sp. NPDC049633]|uniref:hypothetical protein n=1 Tax=Microbispora sp. NPDC049633 TaxID=3154355 RepID=UPI0034216672